jgi:nucleotide-binding universal stress UspA family protein
VSSALAQHPSHPLAIVPVGGQRTAENQAKRHLILVGIDGSDQALLALRWAAAEAERLACTLEVILVWSMPLLEFQVPSSPRYDTEPAARRAARDSLDSQMKRLPVADRADVTSRIYKGDAAEVLLRESAHANLLVVGTRGFGFIRQHVLGSTSHALLEQCDIPLVIVPTAAAEGADQRI